MSTITLGELLQVHAVVVGKETADKDTLAKLTTLTTSLDVLRPLLVQWATGGFSTTVPIQSYNITAPVTCADGTKRALCEYIEYLLNTTMGGLMAQLTALAPEVIFSYAFPEDTALAIFAARGPVVPPAPVTVPPVLPLELPPAPAPVVPAPAPADEVV
jgi:hypothetical protein